MRLDPKWIATFADVFRLCGVQAGDACVVLSETQSRSALVQLSEMALASLGARWFHVVLPTPRQSAPVPVRSTGASDAIGGLGPVVQALAGSAFIADCTVEGLQHAAELPLILKGGARVLAISNEHPEILERTAPRAEDEAPVRDAMRRLKAARRMRVRSAAGTDLAIALADARVGGVWGFSARPGSLSHWPGGLVLAFPAAGSVHGTLVLDRGDVNLTFKRYLQDPVHLAIEHDHVVAIEGDSVDADLVRGYFEAWADRSAFVAASAALCDRFLTEPLDAVRSNLRLFQAMAAQAGVPYRTPALDRIVALAEDHLGEPGPQLAVVVDLGEGEIVERQGFQRSDRLVRRGLAGANVLQIERTGGGAGGYIGFDYLKLEADTVALLDTDGDGMPRWFEETYGFSDDSSADAAGGFALSNARCLRAF